ncbi:hypothetical protein T02_6746 [Trichinella nativa]|uniref:Uncharacterized protein n=1 Tax=Trichinella nativa TaxID=6335 RepID=A0A0V1L8H5_9BILA|nr:hypothetical protein T02_6746 [Trichinella nativa]
MVKKVGLGIEGGKRVAIFECNPPPLVQLLVLNFQQQQRAIVDRYPKRPLGNNGY